MRLQRSKKTPIVRIAVFLFLVLDVVLLLVWLNKPKISPNMADSSMPEINELSAKNMNFTELSKYFVDLANKKGAPYAYNVLRVAPIPTNIDMHLLGHVVGDELYKQQGAAGIKVCTNDFRNACSHSIVVGLLLEKGENALDEIIEACKQAPGGKGAYTMCFHGLGHGILAYTGYDLPKAIDLCGKTGTGGESPQCVGGSVMEIIGGGFHNKALWDKQSPKYFKANDPLYPCTADFMPRSAATFCYIYLTPHLFKAAGTDLGNPDPSYFGKAFKFCSRLPSTDANRRICYGGFGKEFVVLAQGRDIRGRAIESMTEAQLKKVDDWCNMADDADGRSACIDQAVQSLYWGGENSWSGAVRFCGIIGDAVYQTGCFNSIIGAVSNYQPERVSVFCKDLPIGFSEKCLSGLQSK